MNTPTAMSRAFLTVLAVLFALGCAQQAPPAQDAPDAPMRQEPEAPSVSGSAVRAYIDPVTGQLREPTPEEEQALAAADAARKQASTQAKPELREVVLPSGAVAIELGDSAQQPLRACAGKDGDLKMNHECQPDAKK